ncbi:MAG: hypothetical protein ACK4RT_12265, partial [Erythrobacter sp.]
MTTAAPIHPSRPLRVRFMRVMIAAVALGTLPVAAGAQDSAAAEARLRKIEAEVRALQRKVFPGGDSRLFEPQIAPGASAPAQDGQVMGVIPPATTAVSDILVRLDALEAQLQSLTARSEEQANTLGQLERRLAALEAGAAPAAAAPMVAATAPATVSPPAAQPAPRPAPPAARSAA